MKIAIWDSESESTLNFVQTAEEFADVLLYDSIEDIYDAAAENVDLVVFDYDSDKKSIDKFIKKFRKENDEIKILILSNELNPKQLVKHQASKSGGDIYLRTPVTLDLLKSIFEPFFDIEIDGGTSGIVPPAPSLSTEDESIQTKVISDHKFETEMTEEAQVISDEIQKKFNILFPAEEDNAANMLEEIARQEAQEADSEIQLDEICLDDDLVEDSDALKMIDEVELEDEALLLSEDEDDIEDEVRIPDEDDLTYPDLSTDILTKSEEINEEIEIKNKEPDMSGHDETDLEMDNLETLELGAESEIGTEALDEGMELAIDDGDALLLSSEDDEGMTATVDDGSMDLSFDEGDSLDISDGDDAPENVEVVADELDFDTEDSAETITQDEENALDLGTDDKESLELGADDEESLELGADDEESLELGADDEESLELGTDDEQSLELGTDDEESLELGTDDKESLELGADDEESLELGADDEESLGLEEITEVDENLTDEIEFGVNENNIDEMTEGANLSATDLPITPEGIDDLAFGTEDPEVTDKDLSFDSEDKSSLSEDVVAKLAEIDAMMNDTPKADIQEEATGEHEIPAELHAQNQMEAIDEMTEIIPVQTVEEEIIKNESSEENAPLDDLSFGPAEEAPVEIPSQTNIEMPQEYPVVNVSEHNAYVQHHSEELSRYGETIKSLREERDELLGKMQKLEDKNEHLRRNELAMKAELDEKKIELSIVKKRHEKQADELKYHLDISNDKRDVLEEKNKQFEKEYEHLNRKIKVDLNKVRSRERDLENKLEMLRADAELQIRNRDQKILELKRKIDTLQFDVESIQVQERKISSNSHQLEDKMHKVIQTLRRAIGELEEDGSSIRSIEEIKKNLDV